MGIYFADEKSHIIIDFEVTSDGTDKNQLENMAKKAQEFAADTEEASGNNNHPETTGEKSEEQSNEKKIEVLADDGYVNEEEIIKTLQNGIIPQVPAPKAGFFSLNITKFDENTEVGKLLREGILPDFMTNNGFCIKDGKLIFVPDKEAYKRRKCIIEHPFGTVKYWNDGSYTLLKGRVKATADLALQFLSYNMKRLINIVGIDSMMQAAH